MFQTCFLQSQVIELHTHLVILEPYLEPNPEERLRLPHLLLLRVAFLSLELSQEQA